MYKERIISGLSALNAAGVLPAYETQRAGRIAFLIHFAPGTTAGAVVIEESHDVSFMGTWAVLATVTWTAADRVHSVVTAGPHRAIRARISTAVAGGTVNVDVTTAK